MYAILASLLAFAASVHAKPSSDSRTFAVNYFYGDGPLLEGRYDPIVTPGEVSGHVHTIMGGNAFALEMGDETALGAECTNSKPKADKSNYWWPKLYFHDPNNGSFIDVDLYYAKIYYFSEPTDDVTKAFPPGLRMVSGNAMKRSPTSQKGDLNIDPAKGDINSVQFMCGMTDKGAKPFGDLTDAHDNGHGAGFPDAHCDGYTTPLRYDIHFPSCYDPSVDFTDYKNSMAFPSSEGATHGQNCPKGWIHTPHIFMEVYWATDAFKDLWTPGQGKQPFVLASGDPTGFGLHADFISGWDEKELQNLIDGCDAGDAGFDKCPTIDANGGVNPSEDRCEMKPLTDEVIHGVLEKLPGCNPLQYGPEDATPQTGNCGGEITNNKGADTGSNKSSSASSAPAATKATATTTATTATAEAPTTTMATKVSTTAPVASTHHKKPAPSSKHKSNHGHKHIKYVTKTEIVKAYVTAHPRALVRL